MSHIAVAFYRAAAGNRWDRVVAAATGSQFSHCELVFGDSLRLSTPALNAKGEGSLCFSASPREGGTRFKRIPLDEQAPDLLPKWRIVHLDMIDQQLAQQILDWCAFHDGERYDWPGVLSLGLASVTLATGEVPQWWFCSEVCFRALCNGLFTCLEVPARVTPQRLYDFCIATRHLWERNLWRPAVK
jgi:hypothetical protein